LHVLEAEHDGDRILLTHESHSRRPFAEGAVQAAEWLVNAKPGVYDFREIFDQLSN
jgi:4-hydroxy-tetrahydrodipicolinate reductase